MKKISYLCCLITLLVGCSKTNNSYTPNQVVTNVNNVTFLSTPASQTFRINFSCGKNWTASLTDPNGTPKWLTISASEGSIQDTTITITTNSTDTTYDNRVAYLTITSGSANQIVTITQKGKDGLLLPQRKYTLSSRASNISVKLESNVTYTMTMPTDAPWLVCTQGLTKSLPAFTKKFTLTPNTDETDRMAQVIFSSAQPKMQDTLTIVQLAPNWSSIADKSDSSLIQNFWNTSAHYFKNKPSDNGFGYWPQAHALDVFVDAYMRTNSTNYLPYFDQWYTGVQAKNGNTFTNDYYDDMEWNALAMLRTFDATNDPKWKTASEAVWANIQGGWDNVLGGGFYWRKNDFGGKNACSNGPACILAARLYERFNDSANKDWAIKTYAWEKTNLFNQSIGVIYDNISTANGSITDWRFSYNQGTFIGSAVELYKITGDRTYLNDAVTVANYVVNSMSTNGTLNAVGGGDGALFNGIFIRYFTQLILCPDLDPTIRDNYAQYIRANANNLWNNGTYEYSSLFGNNWNTAPTGISDGNVELNAQESGCMLMEAAALLKKTVYFRQKIASICNLYKFMNSRNLTHE